MPESQKAETAPLRVAVIITEIGAPSEIWSLRQIEAFADVEATLFGWRRHEHAVALPAGVEARLFQTGFEPPRSLGRRVAARLGFASARAPSPTQRAELRDALIAAAPDVVLCHFLWAAIPVVAALDGALPVVAHVHGRDASALLRYPDYRAALRRALPRLTHLVAVGRHQIERLRPMGLGPHSLIPCGAPFAQFGVHPAPERAPVEAIRFIMVGRLSAEKGVMETLDAFSRLCAQESAAHLTIVGDGPLLSDARRRADAPDIAGRVRFTGRLGQQEVAAQMRDAHVFLQHSREIGGWVEGFGVSLTEAGASGLPLIASDLGGIPDQITHGRNGLLHAPGDVAAQAEFMGQLARNEPLRREMGAAAREVAAGFDSTLMAHKLEAVLRAVAGRDARRSLS